MRTRIGSVALLAAFIGISAAYGDAPPPIPLPAEGRVVLPSPEDTQRLDPGSPSRVIFADAADRHDSKFWVDADYLLYFISPGRYPQPFLTTSPVASLGILGQANTQVVIGSDVNYGTTNGLRLYSGGWWNNDHTLGSDGEAIYLEQRAKGFTAASDGTGVLARPVINALNGSQASAIVAFPGFAAGSLNVQSRERFGTSDGNMLFNLYRENGSVINGLLGYRYVYFREEVRIVENQTFLTDGFGMFLGNPLPAGSTLTIQDRFETVNNLYLVQLGVSGETTRGPIVLTGHAKLGFGWANERTFTDGRTTQGGVTVPGGLLAQTTLPYRNYNDQFVVVPEIGGQFGYQIRRHWRVSAGYNLFYVSSLARPGIQIDPTINPNVVPSSPTFGTAGGTARPALQRNTTDLFAHGIEFGATYRY